MKGRCLCAALSFYIGAMNKFLLKSQTYESNMDKLKLWGYLRKHLEEVKLLRKRDYETNANYLKVKRYIHYLERQIVRLETNIYLKFEAYGEVEEESKPLICNPVQYNGLKKYEEQGL